jgi:formylglycine-generating enzyme required for sulfatase activity
VTVRFFVVLLVLVFATAGLAQAPSGAQKPLAKDQVIALVKAGMDNEELTKRVQERGIDFELTDDYLQALRQAGAQDVLIKALRAIKPQPLSGEQVLQLVAGGVPSQRAAALVKQRAIDFMPDEKYLDTLRLAGAEEVLLAALRAAGEAATAEMVVVTSPNAEVYLDGELKGRANAQGELAVNSKLGAHTLKVSLAGKKDFQQSVTLASVQAAKIEARLVDAPGSIRLRTLAGASISLDGASRGSADAGGELMLAEVSPGAHEVRVSARGKKDYRQTVTVLAGQESRMEARLEDVDPAPGTVRENPKDGLKYVWIPPGTFQMGCSPGDSECQNIEKPSHRVTISKGLWLGQTEVTVGAYKRFARETGRGMLPELTFKKRALNPGWSNDQMPIVNVTWDDAEAYCRWAGGRLPTEAEWEYAARAGSTEARYGALGDVAWYADNYADNSHRGTHEVSQKRPNAFNLYDMLGNVWEWVSDWYDYYQASPARDPSGPGSGQFHVLRGGSWYFCGPARVRVSGRYAGDTGGGGGDVGVRCGGEVFNP